MGKKYIIYLDTNERACITYISTDGVPSVAMVQATPYEESEAYKRGYDDAKHECTDCQKIMTDAEQERVDKAYQQGLEDARNRKATCEFCEYAGNDESNEPCVRCCCGYINMFRPKGVVPKADSRIRKKIEGIMESLDCTISDFEKAIEEMKNEAD